MSDPAQNVRPVHFSAADLCKIRLHTIRDKKLTCTEEPIENFLRDDYKLNNSQAGLLWIHVPVNNMIWVEQCIQKCGHQMHELHWTMSVRPALSDMIKIPLHSRHMELKCNWRHRTDAQESGYPLCTVYLPYLNWDQYHQYLSLAGTYSCYQSGKPLEALRDSASYREAVEYKMSQYLTPESGRSLHPRRTLDQFYYSSLDDTKSRDREQTVSKWTGPNVGPDGRAHAVDHSFMIMIDQLWCWVLDDNTIISCFPSHGTHYQTGDENGLRDLYRNLTFWTSNCETVWDLYAVIVEQAITHLHSQWNRRLLDYVEIYRWATSKKTAYQATSLRNLQENYSNRSSTFDDGLEMKLALEVADIIDELKMINNLLEKQAIVVASLKLALKELHQGSCARSSDDLQADKHIARAEKHLKSVRSIVKDTKIEAEETYKSLLDLLDLKSKTASLEEARSTTKQGGAVMLFTIVTIIFLPLSFFTAYFGQNVSEITGDENNPSSWDLWRVGIPISIVIICVALLVAYRIMRPNSKFWFWKRNNRSENLLRMRGGDIEMRT